MVPTIEIDTEVLELHSFSQLVVAEAQALAEAVAVVVSEDLGAEALVVVAQVAAGSIMLVQTPGATLEFLHQQNLFSTTFL